MKLTRGMEQLVYTGFSLNGSSFLTFGESGGLFVSLFSHKEHAHNAIIANGEYHVLDSWCVVGIQQ